MYTYEVWDDGGDMLHSENEFETFDEASEEGEWYIKTLLKEEGYEEDTREEFLLRVFNEDKTENEEI